ncbi:MAG: hypothetical protein SXA11_22705 [Cyanobacteriota bacterium]|nr:hypothetical protein [Cyanobacteriota bacterium]
MSENLSSDALLKASPPLKSIEELVAEIEKTPKEYWSDLLNMILVFQQTVTKKPDSSLELDAENSLNLSRSQQIKKNQAAIELLRSWREEGDEEEQKETGDYLRRVLDEE